MKVSHTDSVVDLNENNFFSDKQQTCNTAMTYCVLPQCGLYQICIFQRSNKGHNNLLHIEIEGNTMHLLLIIVCNSFELFTTKQIKQTAASLHPFGNLSC